MAARVSRKEYSSVKTPMISPWLERCTLILLSVGERGNYLSTLR